MGNTSRTVSSTIICIANHISKPVNAAILNYLAFEAEPKISHLEQGYDHGWGTNTIIYQHE